MDLHGCHMIHSVCSAGWVPSGMPPLSLTCAVGLGSTLPYSYSFKAGTLSCCNPCCVASSKKHETLPLCACVPVCVCVRVSVCLESTASWQEGQHLSSISTVQHMCSAMMLYIVHVHSCTYCRKLLALCLCLARSKPF